LEVILVINPPARPHLERHINFGAENDLSDPSKLKNNTKTC